jgi:replication factor A1
MKVAELKDGMRRVDVQGVITEAQEPRTVTIKSTNEERQVCHFTFQDMDGGIIDFVLWGEDIAAVKKDSIVSLTNGYVSSWQGKLQLNKGKYGKMTIQ